MTDDFTELRHNICENTECPSYHVPEYGSCHGLSRGMQALYTIKADVFGDTINGTRVLKFLKTNVRIELQLMHLCPLLFIYLKGP